MFENNSIWVSGKAKEKIKNHSFVVYHENGELTNPRDRDEIATKVFVFVDENSTFGNDMVLDEHCVFDVGSYVRCLRVHILA